MSVQRAAGHHLLGRLEEQPDPARAAARGRAPRPARAPAPTSAAVCTSWPQACATPATVLAHGSSVRSWTGSASRSARSATSGPVGAEVGDQAGAAAAA